MDKMQQRKCSGVTRQTLALAAAVLLGLGPAVVRAEADPGPPLSQKQLEQQRKQLRAEGVRRQAFEERRRAFEARHAERQWSMQEGRAGQRVRRAER